MNTAENIIAKFGGIRPMASKTGIAPSTIQSWKVATRIPAKRQEEVLSHASRLGVPLAPADFFAGAPDQCA